MIKQESFSIFGCQMIVCSTQVEDTFFHKITLHGKNAQAIFVVLLWSASNGGPNPKTCTVNWGTNREDFNG